MTGHAERAHSELGPSQAKRWRTCKASVELCRTMPEPPESQAAKDGTLAHEFAEHCLREGEWDSRDHIGGTIDGKLSSPKFTAEMAENVNVYLEAVAAVLTADDELRVEERFSLAEYFNGSSVGDGTADCVVYKPREKHLHVFDYKNGFLPVPVEGNMQAIQYALGAWKIYRSRGVNTITVWIIQPRGRGEKQNSWTISAAEMFDEGLALKDDYAAVLRGNNPFVPGEHCRFCWAALAGQCEALRNFSREKSAEGFEAMQRGMTAEQLGQRLRELDAIKIYVEALKEFAENEAKAGRMPSGFKWVQTPGRRTWVADDKLAEKIEGATLGAFDIWDRKLKTAPALEKEIGKKAFEKLAPLVTKTAGGFSLVPTEDKRPAVEYSRGAEGFEAIE